MIGTLPIDWSAVFLYLGLMFISLILSSVGLFYFISKAFSRVAFVISIIIFLLFVILKFFNGWGESLLSNLSILGFPFSLFSSTFLPTSILHISAILIGILLNYFAIFSVVNFIHRLSDRTVS